MRIPDTSTAVVVLKLYHHCALGAARSLGRLGVAVHGVHAGPGVAAQRSRYFGRVLPWDIDREPADASVERLRAFGTSIGGRPMLVPTDDSSADLLADHAAALAEVFRFPDQPAGLARALADKKAMHHLAREHGVPTPEAHFPESADDVAAALDDIAFPVLLKGIDGFRLQQRTGLRMLIVERREDLLEAYTRLEDPDAPNLMLQEYIPGGPDSVWMLDGYFDERSQCLLSITGRKVRQYPPATGMTSLGICEPNAEVDDMTRRFMKAIGYRGMLDLGYRFDARDGRYKLLDVNPRLGATFRLFTDADDLDVLRAQYLDLTGQPVPPARPCWGRKWLVENYDVISTVRAWREGQLGLRDYGRSMRGVEEAAWFAADDPAPGAAMVADTLASAVRRLRPA